MSGAQEPRGTSSAGAWSARGGHTDGRRWPVRALALLAVLALAGTLVHLLGSSWSGLALAEPDEPDEQEATTDTQPPALPPPADVDLGSFDRPLPTAPLTGVELDADEAAALAERPAAIVKIPNNELAHPHTGLERADVVYEQETEGGTTRFAGVFHSEHPEVVGNIRSARPVDIDLVAPFDGVFVYAGARAKVLDMIEAAGLTSVGAGGPGYFTQAHRTAPHHLYSRLPEAVSEREAPPPPPLPWRFDETPPDGGHPLDGPLRVLMSPIAATSWDYDATERVFRRLQNDRPHEVTGSDRIGAANVVILDVPVTGRDSAGAPVYDLVGTGDALLLRDGRAYEVSWAKAAPDAHLRLVDARHEARARPGPTWVLLTYDGTVAGLLEEVVAGGDAG